MPSPRHIQLTPGQERQWTLSRHGFGSLPAAGSEDAAERHMGLHAARLLTPYVSLHARDRTFLPEDLQAALRTRRSLIKLRCMRRTLHILTPEDALIAHTATLPQRRGAYLAELRRQGLSTTAWHRYRAAALEVLATGPVEYRTLVATVPKEHRVRGGSTVAKQLAVLAVKSLWEDGALSALNESASMHHEVKVFLLASNHHPDIDLTIPGLSYHEAIQRLILRYFGCYGPATFRDFVWWSGVKMSDARTALQVCLPLLTSIRLESHESVMYARASDEDALRRTAELPPTHTVLTAYEDPSLKGYHESRRRYVSDDAYDRLFNSIGEARGSVLVGGSVAAIWTWNRPRRKVEVEQVRSVDKRSRGDIRELTANAERFLRLHTIER
ncbi:hypothetical protein GCM10009789_86380 [Kribbella sancticallisti]|uniref:Winged helix DNA-binding domain-containing protein n=1 Tax=Kribbella sancticallisti TaxID=460087 RepID=A0ABN2EVJ9_9ACTN